MGAGKARGALTPSIHEESILRERKRRERERVILVAATKIFRKKGFEVAQIKEIAEEADVAPGTVYNYFPTKDALLLAVVSRYREEAREARTELVQNPPDDPYQAFALLYTTIIDGLVKQFDRKILRYSKVASVASSWEAGRADIWDTELSLIKEQEIILETLKDRGVLPRDCDYAFWARTAHAIGYFWWQRYLADDSLSAAEAKRSILAQFAKMFSIIVKNVPNRASMPPRRATSGATKSS